jgi:cytochrome c1
VSRLTRRGLFAAAAATALARPSFASAAASEPATMLGLIRREDAAAAAYGLAAQTTGHAMLERIARIDERHAHVLRVGLESLTVSPTGRPPHAERDEPAAARLARTRSTRAALAEAITLEQELLAAYVDAAHSLFDGGLVQTVATIAGSHAQQLAVLRAAAGRPPLDEPSVSGR